MLMETLQKERSCNFDSLVCYPLGLVCYLVDELNIGNTVEDALLRINKDKLAYESIKILKNEQFISILKRQYLQIKDLEIVMLMLCALIFHRMPKHVLKTKGIEECA